MSLTDGPGPGAIEVDVWDLEMTDPTALRPASQPRLDLLLMEAGRPAPELSRFLYELVGGPWHWVDRLGWTAEQWLGWVDRPEHHLTSCWWDGVPVGYFELEEQPSATVELAYFGLTAEIHGRGVGGWLLTEALRRAWLVPGTERVWLHTCSLDGPAALPNYQARGLSISGRHTEWRIVDQPAHGT